MKTGAQVWKQQFADFNEGYTATSAPLIANGVLITGMARGDFTTLGFLTDFRKSRFDPSFRLGLTRVDVAKIAKNQASTCYWRVSAE